MGLLRDIQGLYHIGTVGNLYGTAEGYPGTVPYWDYETVGLIANLYGTAEGTVPYWHYGTVGLLSNLYGTAEEYPRLILGLWDSGTYSQSMGLPRDIPYRTIGCPRLFAIKDCLEMY